jgi:hypothetical protein
VNYSLSIIGGSNSDEDGGGVDGDGSGRNSPSRQVPEQRPRNLSSMTVELQNFSWIKASLFRIFASGGMSTTFDMHEFDLIVSLISALVC